MARKRLMTVFALVALVLAACGGSDVSGTEEGSASRDGDVETTSADAGAGDSDAPPTTGAAGSFTVNGQQIGVDEVRRCMPFSEGSIDLQGIGQRVQLFLVFTEAGELLDPSVQGGYINDEFGSRAFGDFEFGSGTLEYSGDRVTGSATVGDSFGGGETVDLTWDIEVPADEIDCSL